MSLLLLIDQSLNRNNLNVSADSWPWGHHLLQPESAEKWLGGEVVVSRSDPNRSSVIVESSYEVDLEKNNNYWTIIWQSFERSLRYLTSLSFSLEPGPICQMQVQN